MKRRGKTNTSSPGLRRNPRRGVPSTNNNSTSIAACTHAFPYGVRSENGWDLQLERLHRGESLTSFDRVTGPYRLRGSFGRFMSGVFESCAKFYIIVARKNRPCIWSPSMIVRNRQKNAALSFKFYEMYA